MKNLCALFACFMLVGFMNAQVKRDSIESYKLEEKRELKIQLPRNYDSKSERTYPVLVVLDGDYLFEPVAGNVDYQSYWENIPDCIIVGVSQSETREDDLLLREDNSNFYEFIDIELLPYIEENYKSSSFRMIAGHGLSATFINNYVLKDIPLFRAYIVLSPNLEVDMRTRLKERLSRLEDETFYYIATGDEDESDNRTSVLECNNGIKSIENTKLHYKFDDFKDADHLSLVGRGVSRALKEIFSLYQPIDTKEYKEKILTYEGSPFDYLIKKYQDIEYFYGFEKKVVENDLRAISAACKSKDDAEAMEKLALYVKKEFPGSMLGAYYMGMYHETYGSLKKALISYKSGLSLTPSQYIDKDLMLEKMYQIERELKN
ncbi:alpha/beta hydrolase [Winogradskyella sp.]